MTMTCVSFSESTLGVCKHLFQAVAGYIIAIYIPVKMILVGKSHGVKGSSGFVLPRYTVCSQLW